MVYLFIVGNKYAVGIVGHRGYSGAELVEILRRHPSVEPLLLEHREDTGGVPATPDSVRSEKLAAVLLATPPEASIAIAPGMIAAGAKVIDLSGAFRLGTVERYRRWYNEEHTEPGLLAQAAYGLPEFFREKIPNARLISNPGCYPTAANLAIRPLMDAAVIDLASGIVCDAKSGVSGAGRKATLKTSFCEVTENFSAYSVLTHRHVPEVLQVSGLEEGELSFTAQLLPIHRGILETIYFRSKTLTDAAELRQIYTQRYAAEPFLRVLDLGVFPDLRGVARTNFCDIGVSFDPATGRGVVVSAIDNLVKGAAGQAVQNLNLALGLPETEGLL